VKSKISKACGILTKLKYLLPHAVCAAYNLKYLPYLQYCAIIWAGSSNSIFKDILTKQKRAVGHYRSICQAYANAKQYSGPLLKIMGVMKINDIYTLQVYSFMYKYYTNMLPINLINYFTMSSAVHSTMSADNFHLGLSFSHTIATLRQSSIRHAGPRIWNNLPYDLKVACSLSVFIRKMKSLLFKDYI